MKTGKIGVSGPSLGGKPNPQQQGPSEPPPIDDIIQDITRGMISKGAKEPIPPWLLNRLKVAEDKRIGELEKRILEKDELVRAKDEIIKAKGELVDELRSKIENLEKRIAVLSTQPEEASRVTGAGQATHR